MSAKVYSCHHQQGAPSPAAVATGPIPTPSSDVSTLLTIQHIKPASLRNSQKKQPDALKADGDSFTLDQFTADDAWTLGTLLRARLAPLAAAGRPTLVSIALANSQHVLFQAAVGAGTAPDNEVWAARKRSTVLRFGCSSWLMHCRFAGDEDLFRARFGLDPAQAAKYAIHGGGVPIRVRGVEGVVAVVVVSGLKQHEDHGVIVETIKRYWREI